MRQKKQNKTNKNNLSRKSGFFVAYLRVDCYRADETTPLCLGGSTKKQEDTESASATCDCHPQRNNDARWCVCLGSVAQYTGWEATLSRSL